MLIKKAVSWIPDYFYLAKGQASFRRPPKHYLGLVSEDKAPIILVPGVYARWQFLKALADPLSLEGHPVYVIESLGYNAETIDQSARLVRRFIEEKDLHRVIIIAHSKGGLIAKYLLAYEDQDERIAKVIAIATPFAGSEAARLLPGQALKELQPESGMIRKLASETGVNHKIVSIFGKYDNHVWPTENCRLEGAKNIQVDILGHHKILFDKQVCRLVLEEAEK